MFGSFPPSPLVGLRLQSLLGPGSRHCYGIITLIERVVRNDARATVGCLVLICAHNAPGNTTATPAHVRHLWQAHLAYRLQPNRRWKACSWGMLVGEG